MSGAVVEIVRPKGDDETETVARAVYEHPLPVRVCHWLNAAALFVMVGSGLQIFRAFPSFGTKIPQKNLLAWPMGGFHWARLWHFLIMWAMLLFVFGHLVMVLLHGWNNFVSMLTGWKKYLEY